MLNKLDFFLALPALRLLPVVELRSIEDGLRFSWDIPPGSVTDVVPVRIAMTTFRWVASR